MGLEVFLLRIEIFWKNIQSYSFCLGLRKCEIDSLRNPLYLFALTLLFSILQSCKNENNRNQKYKQADFGGTNDLGFSNDYIFNDGDYCSEVLVYNPHTGKKSNYNLTVTIYDNKLTKIYFPNGGWLDNSHFEPPKTNDNQIFEFTDDRDYEYTVAILNDIKECDEVKESVKNIYQKKSDTAQLIKETKKKSLFENTINNGFQGVSSTIKKSKEIYNPSKNRNN